SWRLIRLCRLRWWRLRLRCRSRWRLLSRGLLWLNDRSHHAEHHESHDRSSPFHTVLSTSRIPDPPRLATTTPNLKALAKIRVVDALSLTLPTLCAVSLSLERVALRRGVRGTDIAVVARESPFCPFERSDREQKG